MDYTLQELFYEGTLITTEQVLFDPLIDSIVMEGDAGSSNKPGNIQKFRGLIRKLIKWLSDKWHQFITFIQSKVASWKQKRRPKKEPDMKKTNTIDDIIDETPPDVSTKNNPIPKDSDPITPDSINKLVISFKNGIQEFSEDAQILQKQANEIFSILTHVIDEDELVQKCNKAFSSITSIYTNSPYISESYTRRIASEILKKTSNNSSENISALIRAAREYVDLSPLKEILSAMNKTYTKAMDILSFLEKESSKTYPENDPECHLAIIKYNMALRLVKNLSNFLDNITYDIAGKD